MISLSNEATSILTRSFKYRVRVESWLGAELLSDDVPVDSGFEETDRSSNVPEYITLTLPRIERGYNWSPTTDDHPLAANGQRLRVQLGIDLANGEVEWFTRGWFVVKSTTTEDDTVTVVAVGLLWLVQEARLVSPYQPTGTLFSTLRGLIEPALTVIKDAGLTDRSVPSDINYDEDRLAAITELLDAWSADAWVTEEGYLYVAPMGPSMTPVLSLTNEVGGTIITASGNSTRDDAYNVVVARGTASDGAQVQGVAYDYTGPKRSGGPFNPLPVPYYFPSPLLTTVAQCNAAAQTVMSRLRRSTSKEFTVEMIPNPALQAGDTVSVTTDDFSGLCVVEALGLPYTAGGGSQTLTVRSLS